jgi:Skp family chaperone for outer membrane proteins
MVLSPRGILVLGLSLAGVAYLVSPSLGQGPQQPVDSRVQKAGSTNTAGSTTANGPKPPVPPVFGTIDLDVVLKNYKKFEALSKEFQSAMLVRRGELQKIDSEARQVVEMMQKLTQGTQDYRKQENRLTELQAKLEAGKQQAEREFSLRQAETMATLYKEIQAMVARVAKWRGMTYVVKVSNRPITGTDPNSVMAAMGEAMIYADPRNDITNDVVQYLNYYYKATAGPEPASTPPARTPTSGSAPNSGGAQPSAN